MIIKGKFLGPHYRQVSVPVACQLRVNKWSMKPGHAGIENELFYQPKTSMLFGDAKKVLQELIAEIKTI